MPNFRSMRKGLLDLTVLLLALFASIAVADTEDRKTRYLLEGVSTPAVYAALMKSPEDRSANAKVLMAAAGCELIDYYLGVNNYKNYIIIDCGEETNLSALQIQLLSAHLLLYKYL